MIKSSFKYVIEGSQIDYFFSTLSKEQILKSYKNEVARCGGAVNSEFVDNLERNFAFIQSTVNELSGEMPHMIRYFSIPRYGWCDMNICALAKILNNGTTFMFTNDKEFARFVSINDGYSFQVSSLEE